MKEEWIVAGVTLILFMCLSFVIDYLFKFIGA